MATSTPKPGDETAPPAGRTGRDELNLAEFPITLLADRVPDGQKTLYFEDAHGRLTVTGSDAYGLPTSRDADVIVALLYLTKLRNDFRDAKVHFSKYELIKILGWTDDGRSYERLDQSLNRWAGVLLVYDRCWWNNKTKRYASAKFHILESVETKATEAEDRADPSSSTFTWNTTFLESCQADNLRRLDLDAYFALKSAVAKRLYRFLGKRFYRQGDWTFDLHELAFDRVGLSRGYERDAGKIKEKLDPALAELEAIGFLRPLDRDQRYCRLDQGRWTIRLARQAHAPAALPVPTPTPMVEPEPPPPPCPLVAELVRRGVTPTTAARLAAANDAGLIADRIEVFDWLVERKDAAVRKSPAGYLVKSIAEEYAPPQGFVSRAERQQREHAERDAERRADEQRRADRKQADDEAAERRAADAYWQALTPEQQAALDAEALAAADAGLRNAYQALRRQDTGPSLLAIIRAAFLRDRLGAGIPAGVE